MSAESVGRMKRLPVAMILLLALAGCVSAPPAR
jgi:hypothetical protein